MEGKIISQSSVVKVSFKLNDLSKHVSMPNLPVLSSSLPCIEYRDGLVWESSFNFFFFVFFFFLVFYIT